MKTMQHVMNLPLPAGTTKDCPKEFEPYFFASFNPDFICCQDYKHMLVKALRALMNKELKIGSSVASRSILLKLLDFVGKPVAGITRAQLSQNMDRMSYDIASKVCSPKLTNELKRPEEQASRGYLEMMYDMQVAYIFEDTKPKERILAAWRSCIFGRLWRSALIGEKQNKTASKDTLQGTLRDNFISTNLAACIEINGHALLIFHNYCRMLGRADLFVPSTLTSQDCEGTFRTYRSLTGVRSTIINMDIMEMLGRSKKFQVIENATTAIKDFQKKKPRKCVFIPENLLSDVDISLILQEGTNHASQVMSKFGKNYDFVS